MDPLQFSIGGIALAIGFAGLRKDWVFGWVYQAKVKDLDEMTKDRDFWRDTALKSMGHTDKALEAATRTERNG